MAQTQTPSNKARIRWVEDYRSQVLPSKAKHNNHKHNPSSSPVVVVVTA
jgi:hypothetical protein